MRRKDAPVFPVLFGCIALVDVLVDKRKAIALGGCPLAHTRRSWNAQRTAPLKNMYDWGDRSLPVTARLRSKFFITLGGPQAHGHSFEEPVGKTAGYFRFLPGAARLRSRFFINIGGPQGHATP